MSASEIHLHLRRRDGWNWYESLFWFALLIVIFAIPSRTALVNEILCAGLFALSLDLILGFTGLVSLGQAAFLGVGGYTAAILANAGYGDPTLGLIMSMVATTLVGLFTAPLLLRGADLTRLMVTMGVALMLGELANKNAELTGGADGLNFSVTQLFGRYTIGSLGDGPRNAALYSFVVLLLLFSVAKMIVRSPFGVSLTAIRENPIRAVALGISTSRRIVAIYSLSAAFAGVAGALLAQTSGIASLDLFEFHRSADVMLMLIIGGAGYLYGGLIGAGVFIVIRDFISAATPEYWEFWIGGLLIALVLVGRERIATFLSVRRW